jgi:hypothetical protein
MRNHKSRFWLQTLAVGFFALGISGCTGSMPRDAAIENNWGRAFETQLYLQTANPDAEKQVSPDLTMDGRSSENVMDAYRKSFTAEKTDETVNIIKLK